VDLELEERNFQKAREVLTKVQNDTVINGYQLTASYV
jgi:hypothetical protein